MKLIGVTQRVDIIESYGERRDALDQKWIEFLLTCGFIPIVLPNNVEACKQLLARVKLDGIILTGGNSLVNYNGNAPERDMLERYLMDYAILSEIPLVGVCRGMQFIIDYFCGILEKVDRHIGVRHEIYNSDNHRNVNSYHSWGALKVPTEIEVVSQSEDGVVEEIRHRRYKIYGMMYHPEREEPFNTIDIENIKKFIDSEVITV